MRDRIGLLLLLLAAPNAIAQVAQWDFNGDLRSSTGHAPLTPFACLPASAPEVQFVTETIAGEAAQVAYFSRGTAFRLFHGLRPLNKQRVATINYSLILDIKYPKYRDRTDSDWPGYTSLWHTHPSISSDKSYTDGVWFIHPTDGIGKAGHYKGRYVEGVWHRLGMVYDHLGEAVRYYIDGARVNQIRKSERSIGFCHLYHFANLLADNSGETCDGWINSVQIQHDVLSDEDMARLGGPSASGIPLPPVPELSGVTFSAKGAASAESEFTIAWNAGNPQGFISIDLYQQGDFARQIRQVRMAGQSYRWRIPPRVESNDDYQIRVSWLGNEAIAAHTEPFTVSNYRSPLPAVFGKQLLRNPGFEEGLAHWEILNGSPVAASTAWVDGEELTPDEGGKFLTSGIQEDFTIAQVLDLVGLGIPPRLLDTPIHVDFTSKVHVEHLGFSIWRGLQERCRTSWECYDALGWPISIIDSVLVDRLQGYLPRGTRRLRLRLDERVHSTIASEWCLDDLQLRLEPSFAPPPPEFTLQPWLQGVEPDRVTVSWETNSNAYPTLVEWGRYDVDERIAKPFLTTYIEEGHYLHHVALEPLTPGEQHQYRVAFGGDVTKTFTFTSAPPKREPATLAWLSNSSTYSETFRKVIAQVRLHRPDLLAAVGGYGLLYSPDEWKYHWFEPLSINNLVQRIPLVCGYGGLTATGVHFDFHPSPSGLPWFAFNSSHSRIVFLDSGFKAGKLIDRYRWEYIEGEDAPQDEWFQNEVASPEWRNAAFRIVVCYDPPFTDMAHKEIPGYSGFERIRNDWVPMFEKHGVDIVMSSFTDYYMRGDRNGVIYTIIGGAGAIIDTVQTADWGFWDKKIGVHHFALMHLDGNTLNWKAIDIDGQVIDEFELMSKRGADDRPE